MTASGLFLLPERARDARAPARCRAARVALRLAAAARARRRSSRPLAYFWLAALARRTLGEIASAASCSASASASPSRRWPTSSVEAVRQDHDRRRHAAINTIMRSIGGAIGAQVAAAILAAHLDPRRRASRPSRGFTDAFAMSAVAAVVALVATSSSRGRVGAGRGAGREPRRERARRPSARGRGARVNDDGRLSPRRPPDRDRRDRRRDHVDPRHDDRQRRAARRCAIDLDAPLSTIQWVSDRLPARAGDGDPADRLGRRALRPAGGCG